VLFKSRGEFVDRSWRWDVFCLILSFGHCKGDIVKSSEFCKCVSRRIIPCFCDFEFLFLWDRFCWRVHHNNLSFQIKRFRKIVGSGSWNFIMSVCLISPIRLSNKLLLAIGNSKLTDLSWIVSYSESTDVIYILCDRRWVSSFIIARVTSFPKSKSCSSHRIRTWKYSERNVKFLVFINKPLSLSKRDRNHLTSSITFFLRMTPYFIQTLRKLSHK